MKHFDVSKKSCSLVKTICRIRPTFANCFSQPELTLFGGSEIYLHKHFCLDIVHNCLFCIIQATLSKGGFSGCSLNMSMFLGSGLTETCIVIFPLYCPKHDKLVLNGLCLEDYTEW